MKKVIFVGGSAFSGSTFFTLSLANDEHGFAAGEVQHLFHPTRSWHVNFHQKCSCNSERCSIWKDVKKMGEEHLYQTIFDQHPSVDFIVDSSKDVFWINKHSHMLAEQGIEVKHILMWKTPLEHAASYLKRDQFKIWEKAWVNYHRLYLTFIRNGHSVSYQAYTQDNTMLESACSRLEIPYFFGKEKFWEKEHHLLGGNHSARVHLAKAGSSTYQHTRDRLLKTNDGDPDKEHRKMYYKPIEDSELTAQVEDREAKSKYIRTIRDAIEARDVTRESCEALEWRPEIEMPRLSVELRRLKQQYLYQKGKIRFHD